MPKMNRTSQLALDRTITQIVGRAAHDITQAVRHTIAEEVARLIQRSSSQPRLTTVRRRARVLCPVPGCGKPTGGPRWGWFCAEHKDLPNDKKSEYRILRRETARARRASRNASQAKRLLMCPFPGCHKAGKGPRFGWFCEDHRTLPKEERDRIRAERRARGLSTAIAAKTKKGPAAAKPRQGRDETRRRRTKRSRKG